MAECQAGPLPRLAAKETGGAGGAADGCVLSDGELAAQQAGAAHPALETGGTGVPVQLPHRHPLLPRRNLAKACSALLAVSRLPAGKAVRHPLHRDVLLACQGAVAGPAAEMLDVPHPALRRRELAGENELCESGVRQFACGLTF